MSILYNDLGNMGPTQIWRAARLNCLHHRRPTATATKTCCCGHAPPECARRCERKPPRGCPLAPAGVRGAARATTLRCSAGPQSPVKHQLFPAGSSPWARLGSLLRVCSRCRSRPGGRGGGGAQVQPIGHLPRHGLCLTGAGVKRQGPGAFRMQGWTPWRRLMHASPNLIRACAKHFLCAETKAALGKESDENMCHLHLRRAGVDS